MSHLTQLIDNMGKESLTNVNFFALDGRIGNPIGNHLKLNNLPDGQNFTMRSNAIPLTLLQYNTTLYARY